MSELHAGLAVVAAIGVGLLFVAAVAAAAGWTRGRLWLDRAILVQAATAAAAVATGLGLVIAGSRPDDPLHLLYGLVLVALALVVRAAAGHRPTRRVGVWLVLGSLVLGGVLFRAFMTGG
ncbi:MAG TPA: hypothetical protein VFV72_04735 [Candidatus Limnocylindrales bacterium]|nr:hypothetical protein [Candidatus Limnocylindrales bacterium]